MSIQKDLDSIRSEITLFNEQLNALVATLKRLETESTITEHGNSGVDPNSDFDTVLTIILQSGEGIDPLILMAQTGFSNHKMQSILNSLYKDGKIKKIDKGVYDGVILS